MKAILKRSTNKVRNKWLVEVTGNLPDLNNEVDFFTTLEFLGYRASYPVTPPKLRWFGDFKEEEKVREICEKFAIDLTVKRLDKQKEV